MPVGLTLEIQPIPSYFTAGEACPNSNYEQSTGLWAIMGTLLKPQGKNLLI